MHGNLVTDFHEQYGRFPMSTTRDVIRHEIRDRVGFLHFARPDAANTIDLDFARAFLAAVFEFDDPGVGAIVITGDGRNFCFGGDLKGMAAAGDDVRAYLAELTTIFHAGIAHLAALGAPVIAAVNGTAAGAGFGVVLAADLALAARSAKFVSAYTGVALTPDAGCSFLLPRVVGPKRAAELFLTNRVIDAEQALAWGIVNDIVEDDRLIETATAWAARLAAGPPGAHAAVKRLMGESLPGFEAQLARESRSIADRGASEEGREGIAAFLAKRKARYA
jgi:2-(1,2-epoxy-1,2-dihydrophenyl)acetyl-CoA isomerase